MRSDSNMIFLEVLEWFDDTGREVAHRLPQEGSGEIKFGAQCIVRDSQAAVFYSSGKACDALGPGRHSMSTLNVPILTKVLALPWGMKSPFRAECYFVNLKTFTNLRWGTRDPVAFRDTELGLVRLRAHGIFNIQVVQPVLFINKLVGTQASYNIDSLEQYISAVIVSRLNDHLGEHLDTLLNLPSRYDELGAGLAERLEEDLGHYGLALKELYINAITPPAEVQQAIDDRSRLAAVGDRLQDLMQLKMAMALENASHGGGAMEGGIGMGMGMLVPGLLGGMGMGAIGTPQPGQPQGGPAKSACPDCNGEVSGDARFCHHCGHQILVLRQCASCTKNLTAKAKFCSACGVRAEEEVAPSFCQECGGENLPGAGFCNQCGTSLG